MLPESAEGLRAEVYEVKRFAIADFRLQIADGKLRMANRRFQIAVWGMEGRAARALAAVFGNLVFGIYLGFGPAFRGIGVWNFAFLG
jgi:hypothetical protein